MAASRHYYSIKNKERTRLDLKLSEFSVWEECISPFVKT